MWCYFLLDSFKAVLEKEREAEDIVNAARKKAQKIEAEAQQKAELAYKNAYQETISKAKREAIILKERAKKDAESDAQVFIRNSKKMKNKLVVSAKKNFDEAVDSVLKQILS